MNESDTGRVQSFLKKWLGSEGNERANYQTFFGDFCVALGVEGPPPKGSVEGDHYCFDKNIKFYTEKAETTRYADFYKEGHFLVEAKQGSTDSSKGHGKRGTKTYRDAMQKAFNQAKSYAFNRVLPTLPPFLMTCDIGSHFEVWEGFSGEYGSYGARKQTNLNDLAQPEVFDRFVAIFTDPQSLNPEKYRARVTREVAAELAKLSRWLEEQGREPHDTANFLMRCIFTMFAEDVELLKGEVFTKALRDRWIPNPYTFKSEIEALWQTMNTGGTFGFERVLRFNGSFFEEATAFELPKAQLEVLYAAAAKDWSQVEPAIFGTLLERALEKKERSRLGAHYTPRSYVERLVRPVVMEPLRQQWDEVELELKRILETTAGQEPTAAQRKKAEQEIQDFLAQLRQVRILDPACGTGNFLYVTLDLLKGLEQEAIARLVDVAGNVQLGLEQINPSQFLGIEINPRAAAIAELVIWIGYLQWYFKRYGNAAPPEPVLQAFGNIENRDAVLAYDGTEPDVDAKTGDVRTRWGGRMMRHPVTGEEVPDPSDRVVIYRYLNARAAEWPEADYVVSNPPFLGNFKMREFLGDGYSETIRESYKNVPQTIDFVMYWWHKAADLICSNKIQRFGFITTNSISQVRQRTVLDFYLNQKTPIRLYLAIPNHPWVDEGADVRIAMTVAGACDSSNLSYLSKLGFVIKESKGETPEESAERIQIDWYSVGKIFSDLSAGVDASSVSLLKSNSELSSTGVKLHGAGFILTKKEALSMGYGTDSINHKVIKQYKNGRDLTGNCRDFYVIDFDNFTKEEASKYHEPYQRVLETVKPERDINRDQQRRDFWWRFGRSNQQMRQSLIKLDRYIATAETAKHRTFIFLNSDILADNKIITIALQDANFLGLLNSRVHVCWALATGGRLGVGNDPVYVKTKCFDAFPFPDSTPEQKQKIRELGDRLDTHRKQVQAAHPEITITGMYNLLEKLRAGQPFTDGDREYNNKALVSTLKQIHDELDVAVLEAYGWDDLVSMLRPSPLAPLPAGEGNRIMPPSPLGRRAGDEGHIEEDNPESLDSSHTLGPSPLAPLPAGEGNRKSDWDNEFSQLAGRWRQIPEAFLQRVRQLRQQQTPAEKFLWELLRDRRFLDAKFRRQHTLGPYIADFYCHKAHLVIELDGAIHQTQALRDRDRDQWMQANGLTVLRFPNDAVYQKTVEVLNAIAEVICPSLLAPLPEIEGNRLVPPSPLGRRAGDEGKSMNDKSLDEIILERLVALNAERAAEERNGLIRWLRPEYQAPDQAKPTQTTLEGVGLEEEAAIVAPVEQQKWPTQPKAQLAAIRDLLRTSSGEWTALQIASQFTGRNTQKKLDAVRENCDRLEWFGLLIRQEEAGVPYWQYAELQQTA
jgi:very-short-patch-repair endonuclease